MKIAAIHSYLYQKRGAELAFLNMVLSLKMKGHEIDIYSLEISEEFSQIFEKKSIHYYTMNFNKSTIFKKFKKLNQIRKIYPILSFYKLVKKINSKQYDIAFVHHSQTSIIIPFLKIAVIYYCQEPLRIFLEPELPARGFRPYRSWKLILPMLLYNYLDYLSVRKAELVLANSDFSRETIWKSYGVFPITNYLGVDIIKFRKIPIAKEHLILSIGAIHPLKGHDFIINSVGKLNDSNRPEIVIIGSGNQQDKDYLFNLANKQHVILRIYEEINDQLLISLYNKAKITVSGAIMEPFGLFAIESMACETPVIAVREGGLRESITNDTGILVNRDEIKFAESIQYLLDNPEIAEKMGKEGRKRVELYFTWDKCAENLENSFQSIINK